MITKEACRWRGTSLFDVVVNLNLKGPFRLTALVGERMVAAGRGSIIHVSTTGSIRTSPSIASYAAAEAGRNSLTDSLALALGAAAGRQAQRDRRRDALPASDAYSYTTGATLRVDGGIP